MLEYYIDMTNPHMLKLIVLWYVISCRW